jgi:hypothetical protein
MEFLGIHGILEILRHFAEFLGILILEVFEKVGACGWSSEMKNPENFCKFEQDFRISNFCVSTVRGDPYGENAGIGNPGILQGFAEILRILHFWASPTGPYLLKNL